MRDWKFWDWVTYICLLVAAVLISAREPAEKVPAMNWITSSAWSYVPLLLVAIASVLLITRALFIRGRPAPSPTTDVVDAEAYRAELKQRAIKNRLVLNQPTSGPQSDPFPVFGSPRQEAGEPYRSWWHIPITVSESSGQNRIENATVELRWDGHPGPATLLQWRQHGARRGVREVTLLEGRNALVPVVLRDEGAGEVRGALAAAVGERLGARITGTSYLADGVNKFPLPAGKNLFRLAVRSGKKEWQSPHRYLMTVPPEAESNGHFNIQVWHEGRD